MAIVIKNFAKCLINLALGYFLIPVSLLGIALVTNSSEWWNIKNADGALFVPLGVIMLAAVAAVLILEIRHIIKSDEGAIGRFRYSIAYILGAAACLIHCFVCKLL